MRAAAISTPSAFHLIKLSLHHRRRLCGISGSDIPANQLHLKFSKLFLFNVIWLMFTLALLAA